MQTLHSTLLQLMPGCKQWFLDGKNGEGKIIANPNIGFGTYNIKYADGTIKEFYQVGLSANTAGISIYIMGVSDKKYLYTTYGSKLGKASISGYCIKFKELKNINVDILITAIKDGIKATT